MDDAAGGATRLRHTLRRRHADLAVIEVRLRAPEHQAADLRTGQPIVDVMEQRHQHGRFEQQVFDPAIERIT